MCSAAECLGIQCRQINAWSNFFYLEMTESCYELNDACFPALKRGEIWTQKQRYRMKAYKGGDVHVTRGLNHKPRIVSKHQKQPEILLRVVRESTALQPLMSDFWPPVLWVIHLLFKPPNFHHLLGSPGKLIEISNSK